MTVNLESTTDSPEAVKAALGNIGKQKESEADPKSAPEPSKDALEQNEPSESETEETEPSGETDESESTDPGKEAQAAETDKSTKAKGKGGFQRRIDKISAKKAEAERERDYWRNLATQSYGNAGAERPNAPVVTKKAEGEPKPGDYDTHAEYVRALTRHETKQQLAAYEAGKKQETVQSTHQQRVNTYAESEKAFAAKTEDYSEVLSDVDDIKIPVIMNEIILRSEKGPELVYELAKNRKELERIVKLDPVDVARELGRFEARIFPDGSAEKKPETKTKTDAPTPLKPVGARGGPVEKDPNKMNYREFKAWREREAKAARSARR